MIPEIFAAIGSILLFVGSQVHINHHDKAVLEKDKFDKAYSVCIQQKDCTAFNSYYTGTPKASEIKAP